LIRFLEVCNLEVLSEDLKSSCSKTEAKDQFYRIKNPTIKVQDCKS
jgi:hypothetical protein